MEASLTWLHNGTNIIVGDVTFSPSVLNHNLMIENALPTHSGVYTCTATVSEVTDQQDIIVTVLPGEYLSSCAFKISHNLSGQFSTPSTMDDF